MSKVSPVAAAGGNAHLLSFLTNMEKRLVELEDAGVDANTGLPVTTPPTGSAIQVDGADGHFIIKLTLPQAAARLTMIQRRQWWDSDVDRNQAYRGVQFLVRSSKTLNFDAAGEVVTYGPSSQLSLDITQPNETRYWQMALSYDGITFSDWQYFIDPALCGPAPVWSGLLRTASSSIVNTAMTPSGGNPLTQDGTTTNIKCAASTWKSGNQTLSYNAMQVDPGSYGKFYVYGDDQYRAGGTLVLHTTTEPSTLTASDSRIWFGTITTANIGGGTGSGGGGGPCVIGEVEWERPDGTKITTKDLEYGTEVRSADGGIDKVCFIRLFPDQPCFKLTAENGNVMKGCSSNHLLKYDMGTFQKAFEIQKGDLMQMRQGTASRVASKEFIGNFTVYQIGLDRSRVAWTDGWASHNMLAPEKGA